jgi:hypothetical protein
MKHTAIITAKILCASIAAIALIDMHTIATAIRMNRR